MSSTAVRRSWASDKKMKWFRHSRFKVPTTRSQYPFCHGDLAEQTSCPMPRISKASWTSLPKMRSRSLMRKRGSPGRVLPGNPLDQRDDLVGNAGSADFLGPTLTSPPQAPSFAVPGDDGFGLHQGQRATPVFPFAVQDNPEGFFQQGKRRFRIGALKDQDLLPEGEVFQQQVAGQ